MKLVGSITLTVGDGDLGGPKRLPGSYTDEVPLSRMRESETLDEKEVQLERTAQLTAEKFVLDEPAGAETETKGQLGGAVIALKSPDEKKTTQHLQDVQVWGNDEQPWNGDYSVVSYVNVLLIPLYLVPGPPGRVFSHSSATTEFFRQYVAACVGSGIMFVNDNTYLVFYSDEELNIWVLRIDFDLLEKLSSVTSALETRPIQPDRDIFERVLSDKRRKKGQHNKFMMSSAETPVTQLSTQHFTSNEQVSQAINKLILSGLRLRGVTTNAPSPNDRVAVREIYQMTQKAALFAVRKFNYNFQSHEKVDLTLDHLQDIIEHLLQVFIDVDAQ